MIVDRQSPDNFKPDYFMRLFKSFFICLMFLSYSLLNANSFSIVFVHAGPRLPAHVEVALFQARLFNPDCPIYLLANQSALNNFHPQDGSINATYVPLESLHRTRAHNMWSQNLIIRDWNLYSERFLYLHDFMQQYQLENVFHMEHDNMIYVNLETLLPIFLNNYKGLGITFDNDEHCVCGFMYIRDRAIMEDFAQFFADHAHIDWSDMEVPVRFKSARGAQKTVSYLPIVVEEYVNDHRNLKSYHNNTTTMPYRYCQNFDQFQSVFDAAALGQFLVGTHREFPAGFINERCLFSPLSFTYEWRLDEQNRRIPYLIYKNKRYRINNLHVHSKNLAAFSSKIEGLYTLGFLDPTYR